jgi:hypothetical protein
MRTVNSTQKPEYLGGSQAKGWYEYSVQGTERQGARLSYFEFIGRGPTRATAIQAAWDEARRWEHEVADQIIAEMQEESR